MGTSLRTSLEQLLAAFEAHHECAINEDASDEELAEAELNLRNAFFTYDDALFTHCDVELPFDMIDEDEDDDDVDDDDDDYDFFELDDEDEEIDLDDDNDNDEDEDEDSSPGTFRRH